MVHDAEADVEINVEQDVESLQITDLNVMTILNQNFSNMEEDVSTSDVLCVNDMIISKNSTDWYEMTLLDEMDLTSTAFCDTGKLSNKVVSPESIEEIKEKYALLLTQNESLKQEVAYMIKKNEKLENQVSKLETSLTKKDSEMSCWKGRINHADLTFDRLNIILFLKKRYQFNW